MEKTIYKEAMQSVTNHASYITGKGHTPPVHQAWFEGQYEDVLQKDGNITYPFDVPALFYQFEPTRYTNNNGMKATAEGIMTLHLCQNKIGKDDILAAASANAFEVLLDYADLLVQILDGYKLPCSAYLQRVGIERDHLNRPLMIDRIQFKWSSTFRKHSVNTIQTEDGFTILTEDGQNIVNE